MELIDSPISEAIRKVQELSKWGISSRTDLMTIIETKQQIFKIFNDEIAPYCYVIHPQTGLRCKPLFYILNQTYMDRSHYVLNTVLGSYDDTPNKRENFGIRTYNQPYGLLLDECFDEKTFLEATGCKVVDDTNYRDLLILVQG